jgi:hypothetical protein
MEMHWKSSIRTLNFAKGPEAHERMKVELVKLFGKPIKLRKARQRLFLIAREVLSSSPRLVHIADDDVFVMIGITDLVDVLLSRPQSLAEALDNAGFRPAKRNPIDVEKARPRSGQGGKQVK